ncbi:MAG: AMP-binding protein [Gammaproteobacteria bacterium]|nr:AMP-binding protein [Gammaproteobacteria bacterium]
MYINPAYRLHELEYALNKVRCKAMISAKRFGTNDYLGMLQTLAPRNSRAAPGPLVHRLPHPRDREPHGGADARHVQFRGDSRRGKRNRYRASGGDDRRCRPDTINIQFCGTTGNPKGATLTPQHPQQLARSSAREGTVSRATAWALPVPLYHCFGVVMGGLACITHGAAAIFPAQAFDPLATLRAVESGRCTALHGVPDSSSRSSIPRLARFDLSTLRTGIMARRPVPVEVMNRVLTQMHLPEILIAWPDRDQPVDHATRADDPIERRVGSERRPGTALRDQDPIDAEDPRCPWARRADLLPRVRRDLRLQGRRGKTRETIDARGLGPPALGRHRRHGRRGLRAGHRAHQGLHHPRRREHLPARGREFRYTHPDIRDVQVFGVPDAEPRRTGLRVWIRLASRRHAGCRSAQGLLRADPRALQRCRSSSASSTTFPQPSRAQR